MFQLIIATPLGELASEKYTQDQVSLIENSLEKSLGNEAIKHLTFVLEDGRTAFIPKQVLETSVIFIQEVG
jgi:hypothetical protein